MIFLDVVSTVIAILGSCSRHKHGTEVFGVHHASKQKSGENLAEETDMSSLNIWSGWCVKNNIQNYSLIDCWALAENCQETNNECWKAQPLSSQVARGREKCGGLLSKGLGSSVWWRGVTISASDTRLAGATGACTSISAWIKPML